MRFVFDSDTLVYALHVPSDEKLHQTHLRATKLFDSLVEGRNELFITTTIAVEVSSVLSRILGRSVAEDGIDKLFTVAKEIYPFSNDMRKNIFYTATSNLYFDRCIENAITVSKISKDPEDAQVPGFKENFTDVLLSGMDVFVISYAQLKNAALLTNDWSLWYVAWKSDLKSYWLSGLEGKETNDLVNGKEVEYPKIRVE